MSEVRAREMIEVLHDVRKAHRLLAAFYRRAFDCINQVRERLGYKPYHFHSNTAYSQRLVDYKDLGARKGIHFLPLAASDFFFLRPTRSEDNYKKIADGAHEYMFAGDSMLVIRLVADSALMSKEYPSDVQQQDKDEDTFISVWVIKSNVESGRKKNWYYHVFPKLNKHLVLSSPRTEKLLENDPLPGFSVYGERWSLAELPDAAALSEKVARYIDAVRRKLGLDLSVKDHNDASS